MSDLLILSWEVLRGRSCESPILQLLPCRSHWPPLGDVKRTPPLFESVALQTGRFKDHDPGCSWSATMLRLREEREA
jgi:hypothetical protein